MLTAVQVIQRWADASSKKQSGWYGNLRSKIISAENQLKHSILLEKHGKNKTIYGSLLRGDNIYQLDLKKSGFIIIGNESKGISDELQQYINQAIYIPRSKNSSAESLNAAIACSIILSEFNR